MHGRVLAIALGLSAALPAAAQVPPIPSPAQGPTLGARIGYGLPAGNLLEGASLSGAFKGSLPLQLDLGYRFDRHFSAGFYFSWAAAFAKNCDPGASCSGTSTRLGIEAAYALDRQGGMRPWLGIGVGYEWLAVKESAGGSTVKATLSGFEWLNLQLGGDFEVSPRFWLGPYLLVTFSEAADADLSGGGLLPSGSASIPSSQRRFHEWITIGVRGTFDF